MNREPYGKKCKCGHHESDHIAKMNKMEDPSFVHAKTLFGLLPSMDSKLERNDCKVCECGKFDTGKKGWGF